MGQKMFSVGMVVSEFQTNIGITLKASSYDDGCIGFMPVYATKAKAKRTWPTAEICELAPKTDTPACQRP
jgi:hypothetical protein